MPDPATLLLFAAAALMLLLVPGPAVLYVVARSIDQGRRAGLVSILGISAGTLIHVVAAALGLSALLASSVTAFNVVKYLGAAYLIYLGVERLLAREPAAPSEPMAKAGLRKIFFQGMVVNLTNPKTALFFLAFLPQFVDVARGAVAQQILLLGLLFIILAIVSDGLWALAADAVGGWLRANLHLLRAQRYFAGSVMIALGVATALAGPNRSK